MTNLRTNPRPLRTTPRGESVGRSATRGDACARRRSRARDDGAPSPGSVAAPACAVVGRRLGLGDASRRSRPGGRGAARVSGDRELRRVARGAAGPDPADVPAGARGGRGLRLLRAERDGGGGSRARRRRRRAAKRVARPVRRRAARRRRAPGRRGRRQGLPERGDLRLCPAVLRGAVGPALRAELGRRRLPLPRGALQVRGDAEADGAGPGLRHGDLAAQGPGPRAARPELRAHEPRRRGQRVERFGRARPESPFFSFESRHHCPRVV